MNKYTKKVRRFLEQSKLTDRRIIDNRNGKTTDEMTDNSQLCSQWKKYGVIMNPITCINLEIDMTNVH